MKLQPQSDLPSLTKIKQKLNLKQVKMHVAPQNRDAVKTVIAETMHKVLGDKVFVLPDESHAAAAAGVPVAAPGGGAGASSSAGGAAASSSAAPPGPAAPVPGAAGPAPAGGEEDEPPIPTDDCTTCVHLAKAIHRHLHSLLKKQKDLKNYCFTISVSFMANGTVQSGDIGNTRLAFGFDETGLPDFYFIRGVLTS